MSQPDASAPDLISSHPLPAPLLPGLLAAELIYVARNPG